MSDIKNKVEMSHSMMGEQRKESIEFKKYQQHENMKKKIIFLSILDTDSRTTLKVKKMDGK